MDFSRVRLFVVDMDGTLLNSQHQVNGDFFLLYRKLRDRGIYFAAASGRQRESILDKLASIGDDLIVIAENGAFASVDKKIVTHTTLSIPEKNRVLSAVVDLPDVYAVICAPGTAYYTRHAGAFEQTVGEYYAARQPVDDLLDLDTEAFKIAIFHAEDAEKHIYPHVRHLEPELKVKVSSRYWVDVSLPAADKGVALANVQDLLGVTPAETLAIGDYNNDLEMLARAEFSYAMANAHPNVVAAARYRTGSNDEGGVERVMREVLA